MSSTCPCPMRNTISSNPMPRSAFSFSFFASSQVKYFTDLSLSKVCAFKAHTRRSELCPFLCPLTLEFGLFRYEMLIREKGELMAGFIDPTVSVRQAQIVPTQLLTGGLLVESSLRSQLAPRVG